MRKIMNKLKSSNFQVALSSIEKMDLTEKKGYLTIALSVHKEGKILLRSSLGIREWFLVIKVRHDKEGSY